MALLQDAPIGTKHDCARCCWCASPLVVAQVLQLRCWVCPVDWRRQLQHALMVTAQGKDHAKLMGVPTGTRVCLDVPLPSQVQIEDATAKNVLWGGHAGPGKSHGVRQYLYRRSLAIPGHLSLLLRENWDQLEKTHIRTMQAELPKMGARIVDRTAVFTNGAFIDCGHMADAEAVSRYLSTEYGCIVPEEASVYPVNSDGITPLAELSTRARKAYQNTAGAWIDPKFIPVTNPGGSSAGWLRDMFVDHTPDYDTFPALRGAYRPEQWVYIPARLDDNPYLRPDYANSDLAVLSKWRYEQLRHGDWHVFAGQFFSGWSERTHVRDLELPRDLQWFTSIDWGTNQPGCVGYYAVLPDRALYRRSEIKFQHATVAEVAAMMRAREKELGLTNHIAYRVADPSMGIRRPNSKTPFGESLGETFRANGITLREADNDRHNGWGRCLQLLRPDPQGVPWFTVHSDCRYFIRTIAAARSDKHDPDDVDTTCDDHALDEWRYGAMSRPSPLSGHTSSRAVVGSIRHLRESHRPTTGLLTKGRYVSA